MNIKYIIYPSCFILAALSCINNHSKETGANVTKIAATNQSLPAQDSSLPMFRQRMLDTTMQFARIEDLLAYRNKSGKLLWEFSQQYLKLHHNDAQARFVVDSVKYHDQELFALMVYRQLLKEPRDSKSLNLSLPIAYAYSISYDNKLSFLNSFPESIRKLDAGKRFEAIIKNKIQHKGKNITPFLNYTLTNYKGNPTRFNNLPNPNATYNLLVFGASWCSPCRHQDIILEKLVQQNKVDTIKNNILHLSIDTKPNQWQTYIAGFNDPRNVYLLTDGLNNPLLQELKVKGVPHYILLDNNNTIVLESDNLKDMLQYISTGIDIHTVF